MPFPYSVTQTIVAGGVRLEDVGRFATWLADELRRSRAAQVSVDRDIVRFRSWLTLGGPLSGIGGGVIDLNETGASGAVRVTLSFIPLAAIIAVGAAAAVLSQRSGQSLGDAVMVWAVLFVVAFVPWYLVLPERFGRFLEESIKRYYQSPLANTDPGPGPPKG
jgi:hypothetical protein